MTKAQLDALREVARCRGPYWWRLASMRVLEAAGLVETYTPPSVAERPRLKARPYRITDEGRAALARATSPTA